MSSNLNSNLLLHHKTNSAIKDEHYTFNSGETDSLIRIFWTSNITSISFRGVTRTHAENEVILTLVESIRPIQDVYLTGMLDTVVCVIKISASTGECILYHAPSYPSGRIYFSTMFLAKTY